MRSEMKALQDKIEDDNLIEVAKALTHKVGKGSGQKCKCTYC